MGSKRNIAVALADFQFLTSEGVKSIIEKIEGFELVVQVISKNSISAESLKNADIVLLEVSDSEKLADLQNLVKMLPAQVLVLTPSEDINLLQKLTNYGIKAVISKYCLEDEFHNALKSVARGQRFYCSKILDLMLESQDEPDEPDQTTLLSPREKEVLKLIAEGETTEKIAKKLFISVHTVNSHRKNILKKLNINSPIQLVAYALEVGLVSYEFKKK